MDLKKCENNNNNNKNKNNNNEEGTAESVKGQRAVAPLTLIIILKLELLFLNGTNRSAGPTVALKLALCL